MLHMQYAVIYTLLVDYPKYQNAPEPQPCAECACPHGSALSVRDHIAYQTKALLPIPALQLKLVSFSASEIKINNKKAI